MKCNGGDKAGPEADCEASGGNKLSQEAGREASDGDELSLGAGLDGHNAQLEAWKAAGRGVVEQAELDPMTCGNRRTRRGRTRCG